MSSPSVSPDENSSQQPIPRPPASLPQQPWLNTEDFAHIGRGLLMGAADIIPGVSGGTVALIVGIYERLVTAISHCDQTFVRLLVAGRWRAAAEHIDLRFLMALGFGIASGIIALGSVMHHLLEHEQQSTYAAFFGLIGASCWLVARLVKRWGPLEVLSLVAAALVALWLVQQQAFTHPPDALWYVFLCGIIGICAMILPGISGAFILLILGKYHDITGIIKNAIHFEVTLRDILTVIVFAAGCATGLIGFSKVLKWLLAKYQAVTMSALCGFMIGSLWRIWPFQRDTTPDVLEFKEKVFVPVGISEVPMDSTFWVTILITVVAAAFIVLLDRLSGPSTQPLPLQESSATQP